MKSAYIDEYGAFGFQFDKPNCSSHFLICAIILDDNEKDIVEQGLEKIRAKYFQTGEIKSSKVRGNHRRRLIILEEIKKLPFHVYLFVVDKRKIYVNSGLRFKKSFYKYLTNQIYEELRVNFKNLKIVADEIGTNEFKESFYSYTRSKQKKIRTLFGEEFGETDLVLVNSKNNIINQLADFVVGCMAYKYDVQKIPLAAGYNYDQILNSKINRIKEFPETIDSFQVSTSSAAVNYDPEIADICFRKAKAYIESNKSSKDDEIKQRVIVLEYMLFRFMNNAHRKYIPTKELISQLNFAGYPNISLLSFRNKIIAPLRDSEVVISSSKNGYKIPSTEEELCAFVNHGKTIIMPMLSRLKKCNDVIAMGTNGRIRLFDKAEYRDLRQMLDEDTNENSNS